MNISAGRFTMTTSDLLLYLVLCSLPCIMLHYIVLCSISLSCSAIYLKLDYLIVVFFCLEAGRLAKSQ